MKLGGGIIRVEGLTPSSVKLGQICFPNLLAAPPQNMPRFFFWSFPVFFTKTAGEVPRVWVACEVSSLNQNLTPLRTPSPSDQPIKDKDNIQAPPPWWKKRNKAGVGVVFICCKTPNSDFFQFLYDEPSSSKM